MNGTLKKSNREIELGEEIQKKKEKESLEKKEIGKVKRIFFNV